MFNMKFRLISQAVGLVAVLVMLLVLPGVTQGYPGDVRPPGPWPYINQSQQGGLPSRAQIQQGTKQALGPVLAAAGDFVLNPEAVAFVSDPNVTAAFVPLIPVDFERVERILADMLRGQKGSAPLGGFLATNTLRHPDGLWVIEPGVYTVKAVTPDKAVFVNKAGDEVATVPLKVMQVSSSTPTKSNPEIRTGQISPGRKYLEIEIGPNCVEACIIVIIIILIAD